MGLSLFYLPVYDPAQSEITLDEDTSKHVVQVLRMKVGDQLQLTDGKGNLVTGKITDDHKRKCKVRVQGTGHKAHDVRSITIGISLLKNSSRFEWFLEKATEIGVSQIIPLVCERTEGQKFRLDRMQNLLVSAMLQSKQNWLPDLKEPVLFKNVVVESNHDQKFIGHCLEDNKQSLAEVANPLVMTKIILIGPEGDFTEAEIRLALEHKFTPVTLGSTRLRTETAGVVAATLLKLTV